MKTQLLTLVFLLAKLLCFANSDPILVTSQTLKVNSEKELYFAFSEGDEIVFDLSVVKGKHLKEVEILEYPYTSKFFDYKTKKVSHKLNVTKTSIFKFRIKGGGLGTKICKLTIQRIPKSQDLENFNTTVLWKSHYDSTYVTKYRKVLSKMDTIATVITDRVERVHSQTNLDNSNVTQFQINLPQTTSSELSVQQVVSWAYWIGVGNEGSQAYEQDKRDFMMKGVSTIATIDPLAGFALGAFTSFRKPPNGDNIKYSINGMRQGIYQVLAQGNSIVSTGKVTDVSEGILTIRLENDNLMNGINVNVKISAISLKATYENIPYQELSVRETRYPVIQN